jgi:hypothetical protein
VKEVIAGAVPLPEGELDEDEVAVPPHPVRPMQTVTIKTSAQGLSPERLGVRLLLQREFLESMQPLVAAGKRQAD